MKKIAEKTALQKIIKILHLGKVIAKIVALCTTLTGAVTALSSTSATTGIAIGALGATTFAATKEIPAEGYEKIKHIPVGVPHRENSALLALKGAGVAVKPKIDMIKEAQKAEAEAAAQYVSKPDLSVEEEAQATQEEMSKYMVAVSFFERTPVSAAARKESDDREENTAKVMGMKKMALSLVGKENGLHDD